MAARWARRRGLACLVTVAAVVAGAAPAGADTVTVTGPRGETATVVCEFNAQTNTLTFTMTNTSASDVTAVGVDVVAGDFTSKKSAGLNGFSGNQAPSLTSAFTFTDGVLGRIPGARTTVLDFGFVTGRSFANGDPASGLSNGESASFTVSGAAFAGHTEAALCAGIVVAFD